MNTQTDTTKGRSTNAAKYEDARTPYEIIEDDIFDQEMEILGNIKEGR